MMYVKYNILSTAVQQAFNETLGIIRRNDAEFGVENDFRETFEQCQSDSERMNTCYRWLKVYDKKVQVPR